MIGIYSNYYSGLNVIIDFEKVFLGFKIIVDNMKNIIDVIIL